MAAITATTAQVSLLFVNRAETYNGFAGETLNRGDLVYFNSSGKLVKTNAGAAGTAKCVGMVLEKALAGQVASFIIKGHVSGFALTGAYMDAVYASNTAGGLDTAAGTVSVVVGKIVPLTDNSSAPTKVLFFKAPDLA